MNSQPEIAPIPKTGRTPERKKNDIILIKPPRIAARDGRYVAYDNGVVCDCFTGSEWYPGPDEDLNWNEANRWARMLTIGGGGWTLATISQLQSLYRQNKNSDNITPLLGIEPTDVWSSDLSGESSAWGFNFIPGNAFRTYRTSRNRFRAMAVRKKPYYRNTPNYQ